MIFIEQEIASLLIYQQCRKKINSELKECVQCIMYTYIIINVLLFLFCFDLRLFVFSLWFEKQRNGLYMYVLVFGWYLTKHWMGYCFTKLKEDQLLINRGSVLISVSNRFVKSPSPLNAEYYNELSKTGELIFLVCSDLLFTVLIKFGDIFYDTHTVSPRLFSDCAVGFRTSVDDYLLDRDGFHKEYNVSMQRSNTFARWSDKKLKLNSVLIQNIFIDCIDRFT